MKHIATFIIAAIALAMPLGAAAQAEIEKAFNTFVGDNSTVTMLSMNVQQDKDMGKLGTYQCYEFEVDKKNALWQQLQKAFAKDSKNSYNVFSKSEGTTDNAISNIIFGSYDKGNTNKVTFGSHLDHNYCVMLFRDPADELWRTCYALVWYESDTDSKKFHGYAYHIYSRDPQMVGKENQQSTVAMLNDGSVVRYDNNSGMSTLVQSGDNQGGGMSIKTSIDFISSFNNLHAMYVDNKNSSATKSWKFTKSTSIINNILSLCKQYAKLLSSDEKAACTNILRSMQQDNADTGQHEMLNLAIKYLAK